MIIRNAIPLKYKQYCFNKIAPFWNKIIDKIKNICTDCATLSISQKLIILGTKENVVTDRVIDLLIITGQWHFKKCTIQDKEPRLDIFEQQFKEKCNTVKPPK